MPPKTILIFLSLISCIILSAQDIKQFFRILPPSYTYELDQQAKDSLLKGKFFYPSSNDSNESVVYSLSALDLKKNYLRLGMMFESGQAGFAVTELRSFKTKTGKSIVVISQYGGAHTMVDQNNLEVLVYDKIKGLNTAGLYGLSAAVGIRDFVRPNTPDSIAKKYASYSSIVYALGYEMDHITLCLDEHLDIAGIDKKWLAGNSIEFIWNGTKFLRQKPVFKN
jgi:hypothetical protein